MIYILKNYKGLVLSILSAKNEESVRAYAQGKGIQYDTIRAFDMSEDRENEQLGFVTPILNTKEFHDSYNNVIIVVDKC